MYLLPGLVQVSYGRIQPNYVKVMGTYANHPWLFRDVGTHRRMNCMDHQVGSLLHLLSSFKGTPCMQG